jgi:hypothetical protein
LSPAATEQTVPALRTCRRPKTLRLARDFYAPSVFVTMRQYLEQGQAFNAMNFSFTYEHAVNLTVAGTSGYWGDTFIDTTFPINAFRKLSGQLDLNDPTNAYGG